LWQFSPPKQKIGFSAYRHLFCDLAAQAVERMFARIGPEREQARAVAAAIFGFVRARDLLSARIVNAETWPSG
jgi:hypothetical protein